MADMIWRLGLDGSGYERGLQKHRRQAQAWEADITKSWDKLSKKASGVFGGMFLLHSAQAFGRQLLEHVDAVQDLARKYGITTDEAQSLLALSKQTGESIEEMVSGAEGLAGALERAKGASVSLISPEELRDIREMNALLEQAKQRSLAAAAPGVSGALREFIKSPASTAVEALVNPSGLLGRALGRGVRRATGMEPERPAEESRPEDRKDPAGERNAKRDAEEVKRIYERLTDIQRRTSMMGLNDLQKLAAVQQELKQARLAASRDFGLDGKSPLDQAHQNLKVAELEQEKKELEQRMKQSRHSLDLGDAGADPLRRIGGHAEGTGRFNFNVLLDRIESIERATEKTAENTGKKGGMGGLF
jgi:hypothetical protein